MPSDCGSKNWTAGSLRWFPPCVTVTRSELTLLELSTAVWPTTVECSRYVLRFHLPCTVRTFPFSSKVDGVFSAVSRYRPNRVWLGLSWKSSLATACGLFCLIGAVYLTSPQPLVGVGRNFAIAFEIGLTTDGSTLLFTNGARSAIWRPALQAGDARSVKSPFSMAAVGTHAMLSAVACSASVPW